MSYSNSIFFIPVWFDQFKPFADALNADDLWERTEPKKIRPGYLFRYASDIAKNEKLFASFTLKDPGALNVYMFREEMGATQLPVIEEVRFSCFSTGVGFMEFWVSYSGMTVEEIAEFSYYFKKAAARCGHTLPDGQRALYDVARELLPEGCKAFLFFATAARFKFECNCFHFIHRDQQIPEENAVKDILYHLSRSYRSNMPTSAESAYDVAYEVSSGDYWGGSPEGMVNLVYDEQDAPDENTRYYLHTVKPQRLRVDYYFMYLLLLNQKYAAIEYIRMVSEALEGNTKDVERVNKRIIRLKNTYSFNIISDDSVFQNIYSQMYRVLEIKNLLADVIENESQMEFLQNAKHVSADRMSSKYLFGISILSLFSALIDSASYFDRFKHIQGISTVMSLVCVLAILVICIIWAVKSVRK